MNWKTGQKQGQQDDETEETETAIYNLLLG
jgi:hypothetical protein